MYKILLLLALLCSVKTEESKGHKHIDPFAALDRHITHTLAYHYFWPWRELMQTAAALEAEKNLEEPQIISEPDRFEINVNVKRFKVDELKIKVKNRYIIVEGKHKDRNDDKRFMANHFVQRFVLPAGSKPEEVTAILKQNGVLSISAPRHELPPPPPEREVPIQVLEPEDKNDKSEEKKTDDPVEKQEPTTAKEEPIASSSETPIEQLDLVEATTHVGKIRKKELKTATKPSKVNEVTKGGENNRLDYALIEPEE